MQAVIYCGGFGSRLGNKTKKIPKPILKINQKPFLYYVIKNLERFGVKEVLLLTYFQHEKIKKFVNESNFKKIKISLIREKKKLGTAGSLKNAKRYLKKEFFLLNGDTFFNFNILDLKKKYHQKGNICLAMALSVNKKKRFKPISINKNSNFLISSKKYSSNFINAGFYYVSKKILKYINKNNFSLEDEVFSKLITDKQAIGEIYADKRNLFIDIGVPKDFAKAAKTLKKINAKKTVFLDRDGVINYDYGYVHTVNKFKWKKKVIEFIKFLNDRDCYIFVVSNQSGVGRGYYNIKKVFYLHEWINKKLIMYGAHIDEFYIACYFKNSKNYSSKVEYKRRKPNIGMINEAKKNWMINESKSLLIGDNKIDIQTAKNAKIKNHILLVKDNIYSFKNNKFFK